MKRIVLTIALATGLCTGAAAEEGMWMVGAISRALETRMQERGLKLTAGEIYDADASTDLCEAIVSLDFGCSGSIVSDNGLVITNHHCAYSDLYGLSTPENNLLEDGYWAFYQNQEIPIPGKSIQLLQKVLDVTGEVEEMVASYRENGQPVGPRKIAYLIEKKYEESTGLMASLDAMWSGSRYYLALYRSYSDIRLVGAPPVSIAAFGGDIDNWEWPQHKGDFALYRIYTAPDGSPADYSAENVPLRPARKLEISTAGYGEGDFAMVIGFPGRTSRYNSAAKTESLVDVTMPVSTAIRGAQMEIVKKWMDADPAVRLLYSDYFFSLSNVQELNQGEIDCVHRFDVLSRRREIETELQAWIDANPDQAQRWGGVIASLEDKWAAAAEDLRTETFIRETLVRSSRLALVCMRLSSRSASAKTTMPAEYNAIDLRVEKELTRLAMDTFYDNVPREVWSGFHRSLEERFSGDRDAMFTHIWEGSTLTDLDKVEEFIKCDTCIEGDPLYNFFTALKIGDINKALAKREGSPSRTDLGREFTRALYAMREDKGQAQYPDANSSMRLSYGTVGGIEPHDAVLCSWKTTSRGILEKENPDDYDFSLKPLWREMVSSYDGPVNFLTDNDITGGNSGSPVMDAHGRLIGLAFDGNKESLASDVHYVEGYTKCVCVDIRYVLFILRSYARFDRILEEIGC